MNRRDARVLLISGTGILSTLLGANAQGKAAVEHRALPTAAHAAAPLGTATSIVLPTIWLIEPMSGTPGTPNAPKSDEPESPLAGPKVTEHTGLDATHTLIQREFDGRIKRLDVDPALAAIERMELDDATREQIDQIVAERNAIIDRLVQENIGELAGLANASQGGDKARAMQGLRSMLELAKPFRDRGRLIEEIAPILPETERAEARRLVNEYWRAIVRERMEIGPPDEPGKKINFMQASATEMLLAFGQEGKNAFERTIGQQGKQFESLLKKLNLSAEQESKVRALVQDNVSQRLKPSADGKTSGYAEPTGIDKLRNAGRIMEIYGMLDADQRRILLREMRSMRAYEPMGNAEGMTGGGMSGDRTK